MIYSVFACDTYACQRTFSKEEVSNSNAIGLPKGWTVQKVDDYEYEYCPTCSKDNEDDPE